MSQTASGTGTGTAAPPVDEADLQRRLGALDLERKVRLLTGADFWALHEEPAAGLRRVVTSDGPAGVRGETWDERDPSANVPSPTALAATWDEHRIERLGLLLAAEARRKGVDVLLAPTVNLHRTPVGGRHFECLSEDPLLSARLGAAYVRGVQAGGVAATVKHFVANDSETERFTLDARVDERTLRELYLPPFEVIVREAGAWAVMAAYNAVNGSTMTESPMLRAVLREEWGFDGVVMSDWTATRSTEAAAHAALDLAMPGPSGPWGDALVQAVREGSVAEAEVDEKVLNILRLAARVGALDGVAPAAGSPEPWPDEQVAAELRATAAAGFVLARNEPPTPDSAVPLLPLDPSGLGTVAVLGPNAAVARTLGGGSATVYPPYTVSPLDGLRAALGDDRVVHAPGVRTHVRPPVAAAPLVTDPATGVEGVQVLLLDADGEVLATEHRRTGAYLAMGSFGPEVDGSTVAAVELRALLRAERAGEHRVGCSGLGRSALTVAGEERLAGTTRLPEGADPAALLHPPFETVPVTLAEGEETEVVLRHEVTPPAAVGGLPGAVFSLLVEPPAPGEDEEIARAVGLAARADVAVVVVGTTEEVESEGFDRETLALPGRQSELVRVVAAVNPRTVVVVNSGAPVLLPWLDQVPAVLLAWFPGQEAGHALADVLLGAVEPGGRLPTTWPATAEGLPSATPVDGVLAYDEGLFVGYRWYDREGREPAFPFGHGLGWTTWDYLNLEAPETAAPGEDVLVRVRVRNTGTRAGREVVQLYASRARTEVERVPRWLVGFAALDAAPGEEVSAEIVVSGRAFAHWDAEAHRWDVEPGDFGLVAGQSSREVRVTGMVRVEG